MQIFDNLGETADRYTVHAGGEVYTMSAQPLSPQGINMHAGSVKDMPVKPNEMEIHSSEAPRDVLVAIIQRLEN